jgi:hypothetical protein
VLFHVVESTYNPLTVTAAVASSSLFVISGVLLFLLKYADFVVHTCSQMLPIAPSVIAVKIFSGGLLGVVLRCLCACSEPAGLESHSLRQP